MHLTSRACVLISAASKRVRHCRSAQVYAEDAGVAEGEKIVKRDPLQRMQTSSTLVTDDLSKLIKTFFKLEEVFENQNLQNLEI